MSTSSDLRRRKRLGTVDWVVRHVLHEIACGRHQPGDRLPSVRTAEREWGVGRLTVHKAYQTLVQQGVVHAVDRSGYFVADCRHLEALKQGEAAFESVERHVHQRIAKTTLSRVGVLRAMLQREQERCRVHPELAFLECTRVHSRAHADEVEIQLGAPCLAITTNNLGDTDVPPRLRHVLTTGFHRAEAAKWARRQGLEAVEVAVEYPRELATRLGGRPEVIFFGINLAVIEHIASDIWAHGEIAKRTRPEEVEIEALDTALEESIGKRSTSRRRFVVLSPSLWDARPRKWFDHPSLVVALPRIQPRVWPELMNTLGFPA